MDGRGGADLPRVIDATYTCEHTITTVCKSRSGSEYTCKQTEAADPMQRALWYTLVCTGVRRGEACGLRWRDVDLRGAVASVTNALVLVDNRAVDSSPKTKSSRRVVPLASQVVAVLKEWRAEQDRQRDRVGDAWHGDYVFTWQDGSPIRPDYVTKEFRRAVKLAGLPTIRLHDLRHGYATLSLQAGVHPKVVADGLGHRSTEVTMDTYSHVIPAVQREATELVADAIFGGKSGGS